MTLTFRQPINPNQGRAGNDRSGARAENGMSSKELTHRVTSVLRDPALNEISFTIDDLTISSRDFRAVVHAIEQGQITVRMAVPSDPMRTTIAAYFVKSDELVFRQDALLYDLLANATIVHEAVHAATDIRRQSWMLYTGEIAGFVAQAWYMRLKGQEFPLIDKDGQPPIVFFELAEEFQRQIAAGVETPAYSSKGDTAVRMALVRKKYTSNVEIKADGVGNR